MVVKMGIGTNRAGAKDRRRLKRSILAAVLLIGLGLIWWNQETIRMWAFFVQPRAMPLPAFDADKAARLSTERRAELERELFTEVYLWNNDSRRYNGPDGLMQREKRWQEMAKEGYELAYLTLLVFEPSTVQVHYPLPALRRLDELARQGDAGAMCLIEAITLRLPARGGIDWSHQKAMGRVWMQKGAAMGHPDCLISLGARLLAGSDGFPRNVSRGRDMLAEALQNKYMHAAGSFWADVVKKGMDSALNRRLAYCWGYQAAIYRFGEPDLSLVVHRNEAAPEQRELLGHELDRLRQWHPAIEECLELTKFTPGE